MVIEDLKISNLWTASGKNYEVIYNGFSPGVIQYIDRDYTFKSIPSIVRNKTYIKTSGSDKMYEENDKCLSFEVNQDVIVSVLHADKFLVKPCWLHDFTNTGKKATRTDTNMKTMKGIFTLFIKSYPKGLVEFGGCLPPGMLTHEFIMSGGVTYCMYSVVVVKKDV